MMGFCKIPDCHKPVENRDSGLCATHSKALRKVVQPSLRKTGEKLAKSLTAYTERKRVFLRGKRCAVHPELAATEIHHRAGRVGAMLLDEKYWLPVSAKGHVYIEMHPKEAKERGWSVSRLISKVDQSPPQTI